MPRYKKKTTSVRVPNPIAANLSEIGRFLEAASGQKIEKSRTAALMMLTEEFIADHRGDFSRKNPVDDEDFPHFVFTGGGRVNVDSEEWGSSKDDNATDSEGKITFSLSDGPTNDT